MRRRTLTAPSIESASAFGLLKVAQEYTQLHLSFLYNLNPDLVLTETLNGGTVTQSDNFGVCQTGTNPAGYAELTSRERVKYVPGQGVLVRFTSIFPDATPGSCSFTGAGDADGTDAVGFGTKDGEFGILHMNEGVEEWIPKSEWNGDTTNVDFDHRKLNVYGCSFQWLGGGAIRYFVEDRVSGTFVLVHTIRYAGTATITSLHNPTLGLLSYVRNTGGTTNQTVKVPSFQMAIEAPENGFGLDGCESHQVTGVGATEVPILALRNVTTYASVTNRVRAHLRSLSVASTKDAQIRLLLNPTLTGGAWSAWLANRSPIEINKTATAVALGNGRPLHALVTEASGSEYLDTPPSSMHIMPGDTVVIAAKSLTTNATITVAANWLEEF